MQLTVQLEERGGSGAWFVEVDGERLAEMRFSYGGAGRIIIDHTEIADALQGQGVARALVEAAVAYARERSVVIVSLCSVASGVFNSDGTLRDVLSGREYI